MPFTTTVSDFRVYSLIATFGLFKRDFRLSYAAVDNISAGTKRRAVPLQHLGFF